MEFESEFPVLGNWLKIHFTENPGAAFGLTIQSLLSPVIHLSTETSKVILTFFSLGAAFLIGYYLVKIANHPTSFPFFLALVLGGAIGNIIDRVFYGVWFREINHYEEGFLHGRVVDMIFVDLGTWHIPSWVPIWGDSLYPMFPVFNVADSAITIGICAIFIFQRSFFANENNISTNNISTAKKVSATKDQTPSGTDLRAK